jgi:hypothetical protein
MPFLCMQPELKEQLMAAEFAEGRRERCFFSGFIVSRV